MKQSTISSSSAGFAVDSEESKAIDDVAVIEERNVAASQLVKLMMMVVIVNLYTITSGGE